MTTYLRTSRGAAAVRNTFTRATWGHTWHLAIPFSSVALVDGLWTFAWATAAGPVRVVLWGQTLAYTTDNTYQYPAYNLYATLGTAPPIEVFPAGETAVSEDNQPFILMQWYRVPCHHYQIEYQNNGVWTFFGTLIDDPAIFIQTFATPLLPDQTEAYWRVIAVDGNKRVSTPVEFYTFIVRPPDPPAAPELACAGGVLTVG